MVRAWNTEIGSSYLTDEMLIASFIPVHIVIERIVAAQSIREPRPKP